MNPVALGMRISGRCNVRRCQPDADDQKLVRTSVSCLPAGDFYANACFTRYDPAAGQYESTFGLYLGPVAMILCDI